MTTEQAIVKLSNSKIKYSDEQLAIFRTEGGIALMAVAGSGKTFTMIDLIAKRQLTGEIADPSKVLCTTFSKSGAEEFETRMSKRMCELGLPSIKVSTIHATCYKILTQFGVYYKKILSEGERLVYLREAAKTIDKSLGKMSQDDLQALLDTISLQNNTIISDNDLQKSNKWVLDIDINDYARIRDKFAEFKSNEGIIDFDDMQKYVYEWLCVQKYEPVLQWCRDTWRYLYIDEFQDTNPVQLAIITAILGDDHPEQRLVVIGDDDQCIYEWRGTDHKILINICGSFDLKKRYLTTNYRCPSYIVEKAGNCVVNMTEREQKVMIASREGGSIELMDATPNATKRGTTDTDGKYYWNNPICVGSAAIADKIEAQLNGSEGACTGKDICILSRNNATMRILTSMLYTKGIYARKQARMNISNTREWAQLKDIIKVCDNDAYMNTDGILWQLIEHASINFAKGIDTLRAEVNCSLDWALEYLLNRCNSDRILMGYFSSEIIAGDPLKKGKGKIGEKTIMGLEYEVTHCNLQASSIIAVINALRLSDKKESLKRLLYSYSQAASFLYKTSSSQRQFLAYIEYFIKVVNDHGYDGIKQFIRVTEQFENGKYATDNRVELRTIHGAKGGEWDTVFILMDDNLEFPNIESINEMIKREVEKESIDSYIDSERRLHYVAQTRASRQLYIVTEIEKASMFVLESFKAGGGNDAIIARAKVGVVKNNAEETQKLLKEI